MTTLVKVNIAVVTVLVLGFGYVKINTHNPAPAFPQEIVQPAVHGTPPHLDSVKW